MSAWDRIELLDYIDHNLAKRFAISHLAWGAYYIDSLYGPKEQFVTFNCPLRREEEMRRLQGIATSIKRPIAFIARRNTAADLTLMEKVFGPLTVVYPSHSPQREWEILTTTDAAKHYLSGQLR